MEAITLDEALKMIPKIFQMVADLRDKDIRPAPEEDRLMSLSEYQDYEERRTGKRPAKQSIYEKTSKRLMPFEKHGKYLYFRKSAINQYFDNGKQMV